MLTNMSAQLPPSSTSASSKAAPPSASDGSVAMSASVAVLPPLPISKYTLRSTLFPRNFTSRNFRQWRRALIEQADDGQRCTLQDCKQVNLLMRFSSVSLVKKKSKSESERKKGEKTNAAKHAYSGTWQTKASRQGRQRDDRQETCDWSTPERKKAKNSSDVDFCGS